jgi:hypothetical protein
MERQLIFGDPRKYMGKQIYQEALELLNYVHRNALAHAEKTVTLGRLFGSEITVKIEYREKTGHEPRE